MAKIIMGTDKAERLDGTSGNDAIYGLGGDDQLYGGAGDDLLVGGDGNDRIYDTLGSDTIDAGAGNDQYDGWRGRSPGAAETVTVSMGDGDDYARFASPRGGVATFDMGAGNDTLSLIEGLSVTTVTLGEGSDSIGFAYTYRPTATPLLVTDFAAGAGGDRLALTTVLGELLTGWRGAHNPFTNGFVRLTEDGADTLLQYDADGARHGDQLVTFARLANVDAAALTAENLGFAPDGSAPAGLRVDDVSLTNPYAWFYGSIASDRIHGGDGADRIDGGVGNDRVWGDAGDDVLAGDAGNDQLYGGDGNDTFYDNGGSNLIDGGAGDDQVYHQLGTGGTGGGGGDETISLGDGADFIRYQNPREGSLTLDLGTGDDELQLYCVQAGGATIATGTGSDLITLGWDSLDYFRAAFEVTDFAAGTGGDRIDLTGWLHGAAPTWDGGNPFAEGFARLTAIEGATLVEVDRDGPGGAGGFVAVARLDGVAAATLTAFNFAGFDPLAAVSVATFGDRHHPEWPHLPLA